MKMHRATRATVWNRREAMRLLGLGSASLIAACGGSNAPEAEAPPPQGAPSTTAVAPASRFPEGSIVRTILGDVPPDTLSGGAVLFHEHMSLSIPYWEQLLPDLPPAQKEVFLGSPASPYFMEDVDVMVAEMQAAAREGVAAIVDGGHTDMGRSLEFLREISEKSGMPIVASGGYYTGQFYPPELETQTEDEIAADLARAAVAERWGAFGEIGSSEEITAAERKVFRAIAKAHIATNVPIFTHTDGGREAVAQLDIFESLDVPPGSVVIGHLGGLEDPEATVPKAIAARGAYVGFDRLGDGPEADGRKVPAILALIEAGYLDRVLLASDFAVAAAIQRNGGAGYAKTITQFVPMLREAGVPEDAIYTMTVENPLRFLAFVPNTA
jgi:phosphotriesterase-related protein